MAKKQKRLVVRVVPHGSRHWEVTLQGVEPPTHYWRFQRFAVDRARKLCNELYFGWGFLVELHVHSRKGRVRIRETYGADPRRTKG